jgi:hypothetical protein
MTLLGMLAALVLGGGTARADIPRTISFQGRLADANGNAVSTPYPITFKIYDAAAAGQACHTESPLVRMNGGLFNVTLGAAAGISAACDFARPYWVEVAVATDPPMSPRIPLTSAAYAFSATRLIAAGTTTSYKVDNGAIGGIPWSGGVQWSPGVTGMATGLNSQYLGGHPWADVARVDAVLQVGHTGPLTPYAVSMKRYIIEAPPASVGKTIALDPYLTDELCRDKDGCRITTQMINWDGTGGVASRQWKLFVSEVYGSFGATKWQVSGTDTTGVDYDMTVTDVFNAWDCYFSDAELYTGTPNGRTDAGLGFGVLNVAGGSYSDTTTTCRWVIED